MSNKKARYYDQGQIQNVRSNKSKDGSIYYNVTIQASSSTQQPVQAYFRETNLSPILDKCENYYMAVARFSCSTSSIPILMPTTVLNQSNVNLLTYTFSIGYNGVISAAQNVIYTPTNLNAITPAAPTVNQDFSSSYYFIYNISAFLSMCNTAIATAFASITTPLNSLPPYFQYDPSTELISLVAQQSFYDQNTATGPAKAIYLYSNLDSNIVTGRGLPYILNTSSVDQLFQYTIYNSYNNWYNPSDVASSSPGKYLIMTNEFSLNDLYTPLQSIVLVSGSIPTRDENIQPPTPFGGVAINVGTGALSSTKILTDFEPDLTNIMQSRNVVQYGVTGTGNMRWIKLESSGPLNTIDISWFWCDAYGNLRPLLLYTGNCNIKFVFTPKNQVENFILNENDFN